MQTLEQTSLINKNYIHNLFYFEFLLNNKAKESIIKLKELGCVLVLWTTREGKDLEEALSLLKKWGIDFDYINNYPLRNSGNKINADFYIDDKSQINKKIDWDKTIQFIESEMKKNVLCKKEVRNKC